MREHLQADMSVLAANAARDGLLTGMSREVGLAAVAAELHLQLVDLESDAAEAVEKGAAALFLAGFGPVSAKAPARVRPMIVGTARKMRRATIKLGRTARPQSEDAATVAI